MTTESITAPDRQSLSSMDEALAGMMTRLRAILAQRALTQDTLVELTSIYNNVAYVFLYLKANEKYVNYDRLLPWRDTFHKDPELDRKLLELLVSLRCPDPEAEQSRQLWVKQLGEKLQTPDPVGDQRMESLVAAAKEILGQLHQDQLHMLDRIGVAAGTASPPAVFYKVVSGTRNATTRTKLARAWVTMRDRRQDALVGIVDQMIDELRRQSAAKGYETVLAQTLEKCRVSEKDVEVFLERFLEQSLASYESLEAEVRAATGVTDEPMDHFGFYMRSKFGESKVPMFVLDECLDYIFAVARCAFGLTVELQETNDHVMTAAVRSGGEEVGQINFDLWDTDSKAIKANHTKGIRNRTDWSGLVQRPVAYVSCRFQRGRDGASRITFQNVHSLFHEFGHAINHLLIRKRISNQSGLEYLPLERLEYLSMWFEKWVYHPEFANRLSLSAEDRAGVTQCQRIKMVEYRRTYVDRAVTATLDFDIYRGSDGGLADSFRRLDERLGIGRHCKLGDFPPYFTWPMLQANPGGYFAYLWGAADSGEKFASFQPLSLDEVGAQNELRDQFASCFDFDMPSNQPDTAAVFEFYDKSR